VVSLPRPSAKASTPRREEPMNTLARYARPLALLGGTVWVVATTIRGTGSSTASWCGSSAMTPQWSSPL
jgi:hypothetical protein